MNIPELITSIPNLISNAVEVNQWIGYVAIFLAMFLENIIPPIPSELIMPLGGFYIYQGQLSFLPVILAGLLGTVIGAFPWYYIGRIVNEERLEIWLNKYGKWLGISSNELHKSRTWFNRYGNALIFWGRLIPGVRTLISVPAGIELMPLLPFTIWTSLGSLIWILILTFAGIIMGEGYSQIQFWIEPFSMFIKYLIGLVFISLFAWILLRTFYKMRKKY